MSSIGSQVKNDLEALTLPQNCEALVLAEAVGWLHDWEKCTDEHIQQKALDKPATSAAYPSRYLDPLKSYQITLLRNPPISVLEIILRYRKYNLFDTDKPWLMRALRHCHNVAHTEKESIYDLRKQTVADTRRSSPFGFEFEPLTNLTDRLRKLPFSQITDRSIFRPKVEEAFSYAIGDTERPINEVTLWDWSSMVAAFYKSAVAAAILLDKEIEPVKDLGWQLLSIRFNEAAFLERVARIPDLLARRKLITNGLDRVQRLLEETYPLGTEVYRDENGSSFIVPFIENLLELTNGQGKSLSALITNEFCAGTVKDNVTLQLNGELIPILKFDKSKLWTRKGRRHEEPLPIIRHVEEIPFSYADPQAVSSWWQGYREENCIVCQLRPQGWEATGAKAFERKVCGICEERREDRSEEWAGNRKSTIWIDEVADANGRVALIMGKFSLEHWLDGQMVFYPKKVQKNVECFLLDVKYAGERSIDFDRKGKNYTWVQGAIRSPSGIEERLIPNRFKTFSLQIDDDPKQKIKITDVRKVSGEDYRVTLDQMLWGFVPDDLCRIRTGLFRVVGDGSQIETTDEVSRKIVREQILQSDELLIEQAVKLYPMEEAQTPARLSRIWETTLQFWQDLQDKLGVGEVSSRLRIHMPLLEAGLRNKLARSHTYELRLHNVNLSVSMVAEGEFITVDNLQRIAMLLDTPKAKEYRKDYKKAANYVEDQLHELRRTDKPIEIEQPTGYGSANETLGKLRITAVEPERTAYVPAIPIITDPPDPGTFMVLVPADKALNIVEDIRKKYEDEIGKVRNRLPLTVGVVFAGMRTPLPAMLDAGRRMLQQQTRATEWLARKVDKSSYPERVMLELGREEVQIPLTVKAVMGDGVTEDIWYPYWSIAKERDILRPRKKVFTGIDGKFWIHISDLQEGDIVSFMPSRLDFEFLDTASRRFEISYNTVGRRRGLQHPARPYCLEQLDEFEKLWQLLSRGLETTQVYALIGEIEEKRSEWLDEEDGRAEKIDEVFQQAICDALRNANWKEGATPGKTDFERLQKAAITGQLADVVELYLTILKEGENE